jgi:hypothetical protein
MQSGNTLNIGKDLPGPTHCSVRSSSILKLARGHAGLDWAGPPNQFSLRSRLGVVPTVCRSRPPELCPGRASTAPTRATCLSASMHNTCSCRPCAPPCTLPLALIRSTPRQSLACLLLSLVTQCHCRHPCALLHFAPMTSPMTKSPPRSATSPSPRGLKATDDAFFFHRRAPHRG